jgi:NAD(P)-dependent dehydrogenase (short-subunit alcohol dehydrogenase family)
MTKMQGRRALVTGATSGLGEAMARKLVSEGAKVAITGRRKERLEALAAELGACAIVCDHTSTEDNVRAIDEAVAHLGGLDALALNAGIIGFDGALESKPDVFQRMLDVNVVATYDVLRLAVPHLVKAAEAGDASVVATSSVASLRPYPNLLGYCVSKAAVDMLVQSSAIELAPKKVRVNAINPGVVITELHTTAGLDEAQYAAFLERSKGTHPIGRPGNAAEVASLAVFLLSSEAGWITGALHSIDGGRALTSLR